MPRPLSTALLCSCALHLLLAVAAGQWWPAPDRPAILPDSATTVSVTLSKAGSEVQLTPVVTGELPRRYLAKPVQGNTTPARLPPVQPENINPAPVLHEEFGIGLATLTLRRPMSPADRANLHAALNAFSEDLPEWTDPAAPLHWNDSQQHYEITVEHRDNADPMKLEQLVLSVSTEVGGMPLSARIPARRLAFSHYAQVVNRWNPGVSLASDVIIGRFHSNSSLFVQAHANPRLEGPVSVAGTVNIEGRGSRSAIFRRGLETRAMQLPFPRQIFAPNNWSHPEAPAHHIAEDARIMFLGDGSYRWQSLEQPGAADLVRPGKDPWLIIAADDVELQVEGVVRGSLLVYSPTRVTIVGDLRYASDPREMVSEDFLGLVSDRYVDVAPRDITGPGDLDIFASIYAGRQFRVRRYRAAGGDTLNIYGSVTAGSLSATEPRFRTRLEFDPRLEQRRPAWFPMTNRYVLDDADLHWTVGPSTASR